MERSEILDLISRGRTDLVFELLGLPDWQTVLNEGQIKAMRWFVYYDDVTALKAVLNAGGDLKSLNLGQELGNASFFGHWKVADFLIMHGADVNFAQADTGETPLHSGPARGRVGRSARRPEPRGPRRRPRDGTRARE